MFEDLNLVVDAIFSLMTQFFNLCLTTPLLAAPFGLWLIRRAVKLFRAL